VPIFTRTPGSENNIGEEGAGPLGQGLMLLTGLEALDLR
jgi:hypothetical protein